MAIQLICCILMGLLLYTSISKWLDYNHFMRDMHRQPLPNLIKEVLSYTLPQIEFFIAIILMFKQTQQQGLYLALVLFILFTIYSCLALTGYFKHIPCSCGGFIGKLNWKEHTYLNLFLVVLSTVGIVLFRRRFSKIKRIS